MPAAAPTFDITAHAVCPSCEDTFEVTATMHDADDECRAVGCDGPHFGQSEAQLDYVLGGLCAECASR
jgi:hypothetical protein